MKENLAIEKIFQIWLKLEKTIFKFIFDNSFSTTTETFDNETKFILQKILQINIISTCKFFFKCYF